MPDADGLLTPPDVTALLRANGLAPRKSAGQNFVVDPNTVRRIVAAAGVDASSHVLEIGPGLGSLTRWLVQVAARVTAVEIDAGFVALLEQDPTLARLAGDRLRIVHADALQVDVATLLDAPTRVVANLPYNVATPITMTLLRVPQVTGQFVMVQREVGERWAARPGDRAYGAVSAKLALVADASVAFAISRQVFVPVPNVDSVMVAVEHHANPPDPADRDRRFAVIDAAFTQRRKTLRNNLREIADGEVVAAACAAVGVDPSVRAETLDPPTLAALADALDDIGGPGGGGPRDDEGPDRAA